MVSIDKEGSRKASDKDVVLNTLHISRRVRTIVLLLDKNDANQSLDYAVVDSNGSSIVPNAGMVNDMPASVYSESSVSPGDLCAVV